MSEQKPSIYEKQTAIAAELKAPKGQFNKFGGYKYRSCEDILEAVKPLLVKYRASLSIRDFIEQQGSRYYVRATAELVSWDDAQAIMSTAYAREPEDKKGMDASQITGTASSYARKYALNGLLLIDDTKDDDTRAPSDVKPKRTTKPKPQPQPQPQDDLRDRAVNVMRAGGQGVKDSIMEQLKVMGIERIEQLEGQDRDSFEQWLTTVEFAVYNHQEG